MRIKVKLWDLIFPPYCVACGNPGEWWCGDCRGKIHLVRGDICSKCLTVAEHECAGILPFETVTSFGYYHDPNLRALITKLKFNGVTILKSDLKSFLCKQKVPDISPGAVFVPMPLAEKRLKERGFNQAEFVAEVLIEAFDLQNEINLDLLERMENKDPQSSLTHDYGVRAGHIKGVFRAKKASPEHVVLIDDVVTTGATAGEVVRVLMEAGAKRVDLITLAIGA
ncbi:MAG: double zinc ribbon domain-containing protein [Patescibacteria group bacterium]|nr:double zinc ribbon domain-containing protein [Patescibacteria group bacterium]